jgi:(2R)-ethylmalonyl-CoA mutase
VLSGSHLSVVPDVVDGLRANGLDDVPVIAGGIIPDADAAALRAAGVARVFTPKDFEITEMLGQIVDAIEEARA